MNVVSYVRVSTDEQAQTGLSLEAQAHKIALYCELHEHVVVAACKDELSGYTLARPGLKAAFGHLKASEAGGIIVAKLDRLTRSVIHGARLIERYFMAGQYQLMSVTDHIDTLTASGRLVLNVMLSVAQWELETIRERTTDALAQRRRNGFRTGGTRYGYDLAPDGKTLVPNPVEQEGLALMKELFDAGNTAWEIAQELNRRGIKTKKDTGNGWLTQGVAGILKRNYGVEFPVRKQASRIDELF